MAGGQERILRRRIKSVESTKKITRAMELIAASRIVKAQQRVAAARPYSEQITEVIRNLAGRRRRSRPPAAQATATTSAPWRTSSITADRGLCGGVQHQRHPRRRARAMRADREQGREVHALRRRQEGAELLPLPRHYRSRQSFLGVTDQPTYEQARDIATRRRMGLQRRRGRLGRARLHPVPVRRLAGWSSAGSCRSTPTRARRGGARRGADRAATSSSPTPTRSSSALLPRYVEAASSPRCSTPRRPSTRPGSGP